MIFVRKYPLIYNLALFGDCCVAIYCFCSGYGLMYNYTRDRESFNIKKYKKNFESLYKILDNICNFDRDIYIKEARIS